MDKLHCRKRLFPRLRFSLATCTHKYVCQFIPDAQHAHRHASTHAHAPPLSLSQCSMEQLLKAVGSQLLMSHLIIPLDRHEILSFRKRVSLSVSFCSLISLFLLCFYVVFFHRPNLFSFVSFSPQSILYVCLFTVSLCFFCKLKSFLPRILIRHLQG